MCLSTACENNECGPDGCGGDCGACECGWSCEDASCVFTACDERECGLDTCGNDCGFCSKGYECKDGLCLCPSGVECESTCCPVGESCSDGLCCLPDCTESECGDDGCAGVCGICVYGHGCVEGKCVFCAGEERWVDMGDGTVRDCQTGLDWQNAEGTVCFANGDCILTSGLTKYWNGAEALVNVCAALKLAGYTDWGLPSIGQLSALRLEEPIGGCNIDPVFKGDCTWYSSSTICDNQEENKYLLDYECLNFGFYNPDYCVNDCGKACWTNGSTHGRCVRPFGNCNE